MYKLDKTFDKAIFSNFGGKIHTGNYKKYKYIVFDFEHDKDIVFKKSIFMNICIFGLGTLEGCYKLCPNFFSLLVWKWKEMLYMTLLSVGIAKWDE